VLVDRARRKGDPAGSQPRTGARRLALYAALVYFAGESTETAAALVALDSESPPVDALAVATLVKWIGVAVLGPALVIRWAPRGVPAGETRRRP
jgi:hypothetical protein